MKLFMPFRLRIRKPCWGDIDLCIPSIVLNNENVLEQSYSLIAEHH